MAGMDLSGFDAALKEVYGPRIEEQLNQYNPLSDWIDENDSADWTGREVTYPIHVGRNEGVGASAEGDPLPAAGAQSYAQVKIPERFNYGRIQLTGQVIKSSLQSKGAFTRAMESEIKGLVKDMGRDRERQFFGAGTGVLALVNEDQSLTASVTLNVDSPFGITPTTNGARFFRPNMVCCNIHATLATVYSTFTISGVVSDGTGIVLSGTQGVTISNNTRIVRAKNVTGISVAGAHNNYNKEVYGLLGLIDDGTYLNTLSNINRTTYPVFKSTVISHNAGLTLDVIQRLVDAIDERGSGSFGQEGVFFCASDTRREYLKLLVADRRYTGGDLRTPDGGTKNAALRKGGEITYGDRPWKVAPSAPYGTLFAFLKGTITRYIHVRGEWADEDERIFRNVAGYDSWEAFYRIFDNLHSDRPNDGGRIDGITTTVQIAHQY